MTRAIHIEIAHPLETVCFLNTLPCFIALYVKSDVTVAPTLLVQEESCFKLSKNWITTKWSPRNYVNNTDWKFNPPTVSHMSQVKANKDCMKDSWHLNLWIQHRICLGDESLQTLMCQVESIINSILFTVISSDAKDLVPRSPNQILRMKISYVLSPSVTSLHNTWFHALSLEQR